MRNLRWQLLIVILALVAIAVILLTQQPTVVQTVAPVEPTTGGIYTEALVGTFGRLNPLLDYYNSVDRDVNRLIFSGLIRFNDRGMPEGDLAESWGISQDGKVYNFSIRPNAKWHDGEPVTSDDILLTVDYLRSEALPVPIDLRELWEQVEVNLLDEKTIQFRLPEPFAPFLDYLTFGLLPNHLLESVAPEDLIDHPFNLNPDGTGPYQFERLLTEDGMIQGVALTPYSEYYLDRPFIDQIVFQYYPDESAALAAYREGEVLGISHVSQAQLSEVLEEPDLNLYTGRMPRLTLVFLNLDEPRLPFFQDATIRRGLLMGINRQRLIDTVLSGQGIIADGPVFPGNWAYYSAIEQIRYDPDTAERKLIEAGYGLPVDDGNVRVKDEIELSFEMVYPDDPDHAEIFEFIRSEWAKIGVEVIPNPVPYDELIINYLEPRTYQSALIDIDLIRSPDPDPYPFWDQAQITGGQNYAQWNDRQASEYLELARITVDIEERAKAYRNFQVRFTQEMPALPLFYPVYSYAVDSQVQGVRIGPLFDTSDRFSTISSWFLVVSRPAVVEITPSSSP